MLTGPGLLAALFISTHNLKLLSKSWSAERIRLRVWLVICLRGV